MMLSVFTASAYGAWGVMFIVWFIGFFRNKRTMKVQHPAEQVLVLVLLGFSFSMLFDTNRYVGWFGARLIPDAALIGWIGALLAWASAAFAIWARLTLGKNWSGAVVTLKKDHALVTSGPYAIVRHPIYSGFLFAALGTALTIGLAAGAVGIVLMLVAFLIRIRHEERLMTEQFPQAYPHYKARTKALVPYVI